MKFPRTPLGKLFELRGRIQRRTRGDERPWTVEMGVHVPDPKEYRSKILVGDDYVPTEYYGWRLESWSEPQMKYGKKFMFRSKQFTPRLSVSLKPEQKVISEEKKKNVAGLLWDISAVPTEGLLSIYRPTTFSLGSLKGAPKRYRESYQYFKERNRPELSNVIPVSRERFIERETGKRMSHLYYPPAVGATMATATIYSPFVAHNIQIETHDKPGPRNRAGDYSDALKRVRMYAHTYKNPKNPSTPIHEFAHSIHYSLLKPNYAPGEPHFYSRWEEISQKTRRKGGSPSIYGTKDSHEDFAESFVQYIKDKSKLSPERISFFEDLEQSFVSKGNTKFPTEKEISDFIAIPSELRKEPTEEETSGFAESAREKKYKEGYVLSPESAYEDYIPHYRRTPFGLPEVGTDLGENIIEIRKKEYKSPELNLSRVVPMELSLEPSEKEIEGFAEGELSVKGAINEPFYSFGSFKGLEKFTPVESERKAEAESREYAGSEEQIEKEAEAISKKKG